MNTNPKRFMGLTTPIKSKTDTMLNDLLIDLYLAMDQYFQVDTGKSDNLREFVEVSKDLHPDALYFWEWMDDKGFDLLKVLDKRLPESDEIIDFLHYRKVILDMDVSSGSLDIFLLSITELLLTVSEFITSYFETAATAIDITEEKIPLPENKFQDNENSWKVIGSSVTNGAGLLLYG
ncbi:hypothetical protein [Sporosarcina sp. E16_8]|uniref:hypothetical protein n=1 Tax=Sporosarcina sp. E16_8 TaxID=2789295 RepID=UPI001A938DF5|nr:hypothetical protein [Sporosarcina sp. E16_8]MBO0588901.1 hypothetical protein [Sporosarcina sp. E16_8]